MKILILFIIIIIYFYLIIPKINYTNNNILIISGTHGDETSPIIYFKNLYAKGNLKGFNKNESETREEPGGFYKNRYAKGNLKGFNNIKTTNVNLINPVNKLGYLLKTRNGFLQPDINRQYIQKPIYPINYFVVNCMQTIKNKYNNCVIFDFHESKDYNNLNKNSLGQTIYVNTYLIKYLQQVNKINSLYELIDILNNNVKYPHQKYKLLYTLLYEPNTLDDYCNKNDFCYCLIEISNKLDLQVRLNHINIIYNFIQKLL